jgi:L-lysine 6-transaminase
MVRSTHFMRIVEQDNLAENAGRVGAYFLKQLQQLQSDYPMISAARGRGLFLAFNLPDPQTREEMWKGLFDLGVLALRSGEQAIRFRPALDISTDVIDEAVELMRKQCSRMRK